MTSVRKVKQFAKSVLVRQPSLIANCHIKRDCFVQSVAIFEYDSQNTKVGSFMTKSKDFLLSCKSSLRLVPCNKSFYLYNEYK